MLLVIAGGDGDADTYDALAAVLGRERCVVTYDRRGLSRSPAGDTSPTIEDHADDASALIAELSTQPVDVFGTSMGALIGLELVCRHPEQVRTLVAHEPPLTQVLADGDREAAIRQQRHIEQLFHRDGLDAAMYALTVSVGVDVADREPGARLPTLTSTRRANLAHMFAVDAPAARAYRVDLARCSSSPADIRIGVGQRDGIPRRCAIALAAALSVPMVVFPGGHTGYVTHPAAFGATLLDTLS